MTKRFKLIDLDCANCAAKMDKNRTGTATLPPPKWSTPLKSWTGCRTPPSAL